MMSGVYQIHNDHLSLSVSALGAQMQSLLFGGCQLLWQGKAPYWQERAINIFPYIARLTDRTYTYRGNTYHMDLHGFVKDSELVLCQHSEDTLTFQLASSPLTLAQYPFPFLYQISYRLTGRRVTVAYRVENRGDETMFFGIGGHPGFQVPLEPGLRFEDYALEFSGPCLPRRVLFSEQCFVVGSADYPLSDGYRLPLDHTLFDNDAVVLQGARSPVTLRGKGGRVTVSVDFGDFPYVGFWHDSRTDAPFVCVEPWSSLPSRQGVVEELTAQENLVSLRKGEVYRSAFTITADRSEI